MAFTKVVRIGLGVYGNVFCNIQYKDKKGHGVLSITGVEGPMRDGDAKGSCGQIIMGGWDIKAYAPGWTALLDQQFQEVWNRWHLNDMNAGSAVQEAYLRNNPIPKADYAYPKSHYDVASKVLANVGLNPDAEGYRYGSKWKHEDVPETVLAFLLSLPDTDVQPAWV